jgi:catechol 2,3-dioxygenase-like lactoylglutathione lyase family enzyme
MRLQLALNVTDLDEAIDFYSKMFGAEPAKVKSGYANFAIDNPPLTPRPLHPVSSTT